MVAAMHGCGSHSHAWVCSHGHAWPWLLCLFMGVTVTAMYECDIRGHIWLSQQCGQPCWEVTFGCIRIWFDLLSNNCKLAEFSTIAVGGIPYLHGRTSQITDPLIYRPDICLRSIVENVEIFLWLQDGWGGSLGLIVFQTRLKLRSGTFRPLGFGPYYPARL